MNYTVYNTITSFGNPLTIVKVSSPLRMIFRIFSELVIFKGNVFKGNVGWQLPRK